MDFIPKIMDFMPKMIDFMLNTMDFVSGSAWDPMGKYILRRISIGIESHNLPLILGLIFLYILPGVGTSHQHRTTNLSRSGGLRTGGKSTR